MLSWGDLGSVAYDLGADQNKVEKIRKLEFEQATRSKGIDSLGLHFGDLELAHLPFDLLVNSVLTVVRQRQFDMLVSFHPDEITHIFDHPDHQIAGQVTRYVGAVADVAKYRPETGHPVKRPELFLWTTDPAKATHALPLRKKSRRKRNKYLSKQYPSQFPKESKVIWKKIFDTITRNKNTHIEYYKKIR